LCECVGVVEITIRESTTNREGDPEPLPLNQKKVEWGAPAVRWCLVPQVPRPDFGR